MKLCPDLQSLWLSLRLWIKKSVVTNSLDHRHITSGPSHQDSASRLSISHLNTLTPANHRPLTSLHLRLPWGEREREEHWGREREQRKRDGRQADHAQQLSFIFTFCNPAKRGRKRDGSHSCWPPCSCCFNMPRRPLPHLCLQDYSSTSFYLATPPCICSLAWPDVWSTQCAKLFRASKF